MSATVIENLKTALGQADTEQAVTRLSIVDFDQWSIPQAAMVGPTQVTWDAPVLPPVR